jgi:hypothetical protein
MPEPADFPRPEITNVQWVDLPVECFTPNGRQKDKTH